MNQQERQALQDFLTELARARADQKDPEADAMIRQAFAQHPDAAYLVVQRTLLQEQALDNAQRRLAELQAQVNANAAATSDGGSSFLDPSSSWGRSGRALARPGAAQPPMQPAAYAAPQEYGSAYPNRAPRPGLLGGAGGSFLGSMAATAAGVAAGSFLFHGIDQLIHQHGRDEAARQNFGDVPPDRNMDDMAADQGSTDQFADDPGYGSGDLASDAGVDDIGSVDDFS